MAQCGGSHELIGQERLLKRRWDRIADGYYTAHHPTTRNFDAVIARYLPTYLQNLHAGAVVLDLGGGRGSIRTLVPVGVRTLVGDISLRMMNRERGAPHNSEFVQMSAFCPPFRAETFHAVVSVLGDSFCQKAAFVAVCQVLMPTGRFTVALPSKTWGVALRSVLGVRHDETLLASGQFGEVAVPSYLYDEEELAALFSSTGFEDAVVATFAGGGVISEVAAYSPHVVAASHVLGLALPDVPLVTIGSATRPRRSG